MENMKVRPRKKRRPRKLTTNKIGRHSKTKVYFSRYQRSYNKVYWVCPPPPPPLYQGDRYVGQLRHFVRLKISVQLMDLNMSMRQEQISTTPFFSSPNGATCGVTNTVDSTNEESSLTMHKLTHIILVTISGCWHTPFILTLTTEKKKKSLAKFQATAICLTWQTKLAS